MLGSGGRPSGLDPGAGDFYKTPSASPGGREGAEIQGRATLGLLMVTGCYPPTCVPSATHASSQCLQWALLSGCHPTPQ